LIIVVMGVAGAGKSTLAKVLATALDWVCIEGDDYHPATSINKMIGGKALDDHDRAAWLGHLHRRIVELDRRGASAVVACSALKASYRNLLAEDVSDLRFVFLSGSEGLAEYADLSDQASFHCNDMLVDAAGRAFVGNFGFDLHGGGDVAPAEIIRIDQDGNVEVFARDVVFPNGSVITRSGDTLLIAETFAHRISAFGLDVGGRVSSRRLWAELGKHTPDGICMDAEAALWVASPGTKTLFRVEQGGGILDRCTTRGTPYACMLGGEDRRTLYICTSETDDPQEATKQRSGRIEQVRVAVAGAGLP